MSFDIDDAESTQGSIPEPSPNEISDKIGKMLPDINVIKGTGILKNTESHKESKKILKNFKEGVKNMQEKDVPKYNYEWDKSDDRNALDRATDSIDIVVSNMIKAGIPVPPIYKDFLYSVKPPKKEEIVIESKPPLYSITGIDKNGEVNIKTKNPIEIKQGNTTIVLDKERLKKAATERVLPKLVKSDHTITLDENKKENDKDDGVTCEDIDEIMEELSQEQSPETLKLYEKVYDKNTDIFDTGKTKITAECCNDLLKIKEMVNANNSNKVTVLPNKNAYELREMILKNAIDVVNNHSTQSSLTNTIDQILKTANQFYSFVENKRNY